jgi:hypothetical protein
MRRHEYPAPVQEYPEVTRITVVTKDGRVFEKYDAFPDGCELHLQDGGRTLKVFPINSDRG